MQVSYFRKTLLDWYCSNKRDFPWRNADEPRFKKIVSEILLQRTQSSTVKDQYKNFFSKFSSWNDLDSSSIKSLEQSLKPLGLWKRRAASLKALSQAIHAMGTVPSARADIDKLPGVGQYIANAIELIIFNRPRPLLDVNMARVLERYFGTRKRADIRYDPDLQQLAHNVVNCKKAIDVNFAILDFAAAVCKARKPLCDECPLSKGCLRALTYEEAKRS